MSEQLSALGPFFEAGFHEASQEPELPWRSLADLVEDPAAMGERVADVRAFLASGTGQAAEAVELRVAASVVHLGLAARLISPLFALAVGYAWRGPVRAADLRWQPGLASTFPLSIAESVLDDDGGGDGGGSGGSGRLTDGVITGLEAGIAPFGVNRHILRGNVASALSHAVVTLSSARPDLAPRACAAFEALLAAPYLAGTRGHRPDGTFRRRSCCLIYRATPRHDGALCGDCALA